MDELILSVKEIKKNYKKVNVLKNVNFDIYKGQIVALIGVNGAGKSTLIEIICKVKNYDHGTIISKINSKEIGYMPQSFGLFADLTVKENLEYFAVLYNITKQRISQVLELCKLENKKHMLCKNLSGGYKQLVSLAVAILHNPKFLLLDEPTSAMDPLFREIFWNVIKSYNSNGGTVMVTTHYMEEINMCNKLLILSSGEIVYNDFVENTFKKGKFKSAIDLINTMVKGERYDK